MTDARIINFDLGRRSRRQALKADQAAAANMYATVRQLLESGLVERAHQSAWTVMSDGLPTQSMGEPGGGSGGHGDPTLGAVMANESMGRMLDDLQASLDRAQSNLAHAFRVATSMVGQTVAPAEAEPPGAGHCQRCQEWVPGTASSRIKSGYCERCYKAWQRAGNPDRGQFNGADDEGA